MTFSLDLTKAIENIKDDVEETISGSLFVLFGNVIKRTPVGNPTLWKNSPPSGYIGGTLRNSWHCTFSAPSSEGRRKAEQNGAGSIDSLNILGSYKIGQSVYLTNNLPYALPVEMGWSSQAPAGMARVAIAEAQAVFDAQ